MENPYEQKLFSMFCGHDKEQRGWLNVAALQQLCTTLELKENGTKLIAALTDRCGAGGADAKTIRITFKAFKEELLHVLGTDSSGQQPMENTGIAGDRDVDKESTNGGTTLIVVNSGSSVCGDGNIVVSISGGGGGDGGRLRRDDVDKTESQVAIVTVSSDSIEANSGN